MSTVDENGLLSVDTVENTIVTDPDYNLRYILGALNSKFVSWYAYVFVFNKAVRTMDYDDYYVAKIPIPHAKKERQAKITEAVDRLLDLTKTFFSHRPTFESYLNKIPRTFDIQLGSIYHVIPMKLKQTSIPSTAKAALKTMRAEISDKELVVSARYTDIDDEETESEILRMTIEDPAYRLFLKEAINIFPFSRSKGNILTKILEIGIPQFKDNAEDNLRIIHKFMEEYMKDVSSLKETIEDINALLSEIDQTVYDLLGLTQEEIEIIERQVGNGIYTRNTGAV